MKYLKTYKSVNEDTSLGELSFEDFSDLFIDITDMYKHEILDYHDEDTAYFEVKIFIEMDLDGADIDYGFNYLNGFGTVDEPDKISDFSEIRKYIMGEIPDLEDKINEIKTTIEASKKLHELLEDIESNILPRLKLFSNYSHIEVGFQDDEFCLLYYIK